MYHSYLNRYTDEHVDTQQDIYEAKCEAEYTTFNMCHNSQIASKKQHEKLL